MDLPSFDLSKWESERALDWLLLANAVAGMAYIRDRSTRPPCPLHLLFIINQRKLPKILERMKMGRRPPFPQVKDEGRAQGPKCTAYPRMFFFGG